VVADQAFQGKGKEAFAAVVAADELVVGFLQEKALQRCVHGAVLQVPEVLKLRHRRQKLVFLLFG
jgi:hypothetical protein